MITKISTLIRQSSDRLHTLLKEYEKSIYDYETGQQDYVMGEGPSGSPSDLLNSKQILNLIKEGNFSKAYSLWRRQDTVVRELLPNELQMFLESKLK